MTPEELDQIAKDAQAARQQSPRSVNVCLAAGCLTLHSESVKAALEAEVKRTGTDCRVRGVGCMGLCSLGPLVTTEPGDILYKNVAPTDAPEILAAAENAPVSRLLCSRDQSFFKRQANIVLENSGHIDPEKIDEYIAVGGYQALLHALTEITPAQIDQEISKSGLRGRGGAGYPTGLKWSTVAKTGEQQKYVICNADEGDPGAFMDRACWRAIRIACWKAWRSPPTPSARRQGYIYVRAEYPLAVKHLKTAIKQAERLGLLGTSICGTRSASMSTSASAPAPSSAARKRR